MSSPAELVNKFARLRAAEEAQLVVHVALQALSLPADHPLAHPAPLGEEADTLVRFAQLRAGMEVSRLHLCVPGWEAELYAAAYIHQFLASVRQELLAHLHAEALPMLPEATQHVAWSTVKTLEKALCQVAMGSRQG